MERAFRPPARGRARWPLLGGGAATALAGVLVAWAAANTAPTITGATGLEVRPDRSVSVSLSATDADADPDDAALSEAVRLQAVAPAGAPAWLDDSGWSAPAAPDPTLAFEIAAPETAAPAAYVISAMATDGRGLSSTSQFELRVLAPLCPAPLEVDDGGTCAACPDHHLPNVAKTRCVACPADTERAGGTGSCTACPRGELSAGGEACAPNTAPHADAGPDLTAEPGRRVVLDGTGSSDPEGRPLAYAWSQREGPDVALARGATARPRFPAPRAAADTLLRFRLKVTDPQGRSDTDWVRVTVQPANRPPTADAGPDQSVDEGETATLDGTASADEDGDALTYAWTAPPGVTLSDAAAAKPTFTAPNRASPYSLEFALTVDDGTAESAPDRVTVSVDADNDPPTALAGRNRTVEPGDAVTLAGGGTDPEGETLTYRWEQRDGPAVDLADATSATASFAAPPVDARTALTFRLTVSDPHGARSRVSIRINVRPRRNSAPVANAGSDQAVDEGATVGLDGTASSDGDDDALTYAWTAPEGVALPDPAAARPTFTAPDRTADYKLTFTLTVNDGTEDSYPDTVMVAVAADDDAPEADAGRNRTVESGEAVTLSGGGADPEGLAVTYAWVQRGGPEVELGGAKEATATFDAPRVDRRERLSFRLKVTDPGGNTGRDDVRVNVLPAANAPPVASASAVDARIGEGATGTLDGSASSDADDDPLTYSWTAPPGVALSDATAVAPTFRAPDRRADYTLTFTLTVNDGTADSAAAAATVSVTADDDVPTADAGADVAAKGGDRVALDGTGSSDPEGGPLTYAWTQTAGAAVALSDAGSARPAFAAPVAGAALAFSLVVNDGASDSAADAVGVTVAPAPRVALSLGSPSIAEDGGSTTVTASLPEAARRAFEVTVSESSPAVALGGNATLAFAAGATASTGAVTLSAVDDDVHTGNRTATVAGALSDGAPAQAPAPVALTVADDEEDGAPDFGGAAVPDQAWAKDAAIAALTLPAADGGDGEVTYGLSPALPTGLSFDPAGRRISGTPSARQAPTLYTYTATDADGDPDSLTFRIAVGYWRLTVSPKPAGGTLTGPGGISCGSAGDACSATVDGGGATLTATADAGYDLESWSGACASATGTSCALALSAATTAGASFGELPACNASATGAADACGAGAYALVSWSGAHGACGTDGTGCGAGRMESHAPPPAATCGSSADSCASGDWRDGTDTAAERRWSCAAVAATETWNCAGSGGDWTWTCAGGGETKSCAGALEGSSAACSRQSTGADASCFVCTDGHHEHDGSCHADHACGPDRIGGGDRECSGCGDGLVPNEAGTACVACPVGRHEDDSATGSCHADHVCGDDEIGGGARECSGCGDGLVPNEAGTACVACPVGRHEDDSATGSCHANHVCGDNEIGGGDRACVPCPAGKAPNGDRTACACGTGEHEHDDHACHAAGNCHGDGDCGEGEVCWNGSCGARVDGGWTPKSNGGWGSCSETACGSSGTQSRNWTRTCTNPVPAHGGADCTGEANGTESRDCEGDSCAGGQICWSGSCETPVDGGWTDPAYGEWGNCSATACGSSGTRTRTWSRTCSDPAPAFGGAECAGEASGKDSEVCLGGSCPEGEACSGGGCVCAGDGGHKHDGATCHPAGNCHSNGDCASGQYCAGGACKDYDDWTVGDWGGCSATACGQSGKQTRTVTCDDDKVCDPAREPSGMRGCSGDWCVAGEKCSEGACVCEGDGNHKHGSNACHPEGNCHSNGECKDGQYCAGGACKDYDDWTVGDWGGCSATACGQSGKQTRTVTCDDGKVCDPAGKPSGMRGCSGDRCVAGEKCSEGACVCEGDGNHKHGGNACHPEGNCHSNGECKDGQYCAGGACKDYDDWTVGDWGGCSATACGQSGKQTRTVTCDDGKVCDPAGKPSGMRGCSGDRCVAGEKCSEGACVCEGDGNHKHGGNACHPEGNCHSNGECKDGKVCSAGSCVCRDGEHEHVGAKTCHPVGDCHSNGDCEDGQYCAGGACKDYDDWTVGDWGGCSATACGQSGKQTRTVTCDDGKVCDPAGKPSGMRGCSGDRCVAGEKCSEGVCVCEGDGNHKHGGNACHPVGNCHANDDCSGGKVCSEGACVCGPDQHDHGGTCHDDHECTIDQIGGRDSECTTCPDGQVPNTTKNACETCQFGEFPAGTCRTCPTGCSASSCRGANVCQCPGSSCPQLWGQQGNCTATRAKTCSGDTDGCGRRRYSNRCTTGSHTFGNRATESCLYEHRDRDLWRCQHWTQTCRATVTQVGCVYTGVVIPPIIPPFPLASPPDGGYERGYLLAPFQCGSSPDTCRVEIGDEVLEGSEGVEDRDDTDTEHRWACRSDTGEVRECGAEKE